MAQRRLRARFVAGLLGALALAALAGGTVLAADQAVTIAGSAFSPADVTVAVGDTVTWTNNDQIAHTATADGGSFDTGSLGGGASNTVTFSTAGSFPYHCAIHADMTGTITVEAASSGGGGGGGGGGAATQPPTDTLPADAGAGSSSASWIALALAGALVVGFAIARKRFSRG